ncbi:6634_t:CDS:1, partial [Ambispora gerdemannii]
MTEYTEMFAPLVALFNQAQVTAILMAWLPKQLENYLSGVMAVDMFLTCAVATGATASLGALYVFIHKKWSETPTSKEGVVVLQVEPTSAGRWGYQYPSQFYEALSWMISQQTKELNEGAFILQKPSNDGYQDDDEEDDCAPQEFNILPEKEQKVVIEYKERKFDVTFNSFDDDSSESTSRKKQKPSIFLTTKEESDTNVASVADFINGVTRAHLEYLKSKKVRSRYERNGDSWNLIQALVGSRGLDTVALDEPQEILIKKELETFTNDKEFYARIGIPYRRGILLYGKPGTGKTSLINAISAQLQRDLYFINLKSFQKENPDSELSAAFSSVPANQIIVLEDVDTQSNVLHKRSLQKSDFFDAMSSDDDKPIVSSGFGPTFSLSTFLGCLDGHIISEGIIIIMTTNHVEHLDPAVIRPGRMDLQLDLGYCTHYQIKKMFASVTENPELQFPQEILDKIPEGLLPPCQVMTNMVLYRNEPHLIPDKILELVDKVKQDEEKREMERIQQQIEKKFKRTEKVEGEAKSETEENKESISEKKENEEAKIETKENETISEKKENEEAKIETKENETISENSNGNDIDTDEKKESEEKEKDLTKGEKINATNFKDDLINFEESIIDKTPNDDTISNGSCTDVEEESKSTT